MMMICVEVLRMQTKREREREIWNEEEWANLLTNRHPPHLAVF